MRRLLLVLLFSILMPVLFNSAVEAEIIPGVDFPKIIYGDPMIKFYEGMYSYPSQIFHEDWDIIDETGFNVILSDVDADHLSKPACVLNDGGNYNQYNIPVMLRTRRIGDKIKKYMASTYISRNIIEDEGYGIYLDQDYPGWSPRIRVQDDALESSDPYTGCEGYRDEDGSLSPPHDVIIYEFTNGSSSVDEIIFKTMDTGTEQDYLFRQKVHAYTYLDEEDPRSTYIRMKIKIPEWGTLDPAEDILSLELKHTEFDYPCDPVEEM